MNIQEKIKFLSKEFDLDYKKGDYKYLVCSRREIIIRNFLGLFPKEEYSKYHKNKSENIGKIVKFLDSEKFEKLLKHPAGCILQYQNIEWEKKAIQSINDRKLTDEVTKFYEKLKKVMGNSKRLTILSDPEGKEFNEILLHEFIHELVEENIGRPKNWHWNEGLINYFQLFAFNKLDYFEKQPSNIENNPEWYNSYFLKGKEWKRLLEGINIPKERRKIIEDKIKELNR